MFSWAKKRYWEWALGEAVANKAKADIGYRTDLSATYALAEQYYEEKLGRVDESGCERCQGQGSCPWCVEVDKPLPAKYILIGAVQSEREWLGNDYWNTDDTMYQDEAWNGKYPDIQQELDDINSKVVFSA